MELLLMVGYFFFIAVIIEASTTLLIFTGLKRKIARYQVISMLTNTGFTTDEARLILEHPIRRKISAFLILFGAFSLAVIVSILSSYLSDDIRFKELAYILAGSGIILFLLKIKPVREFLQGKLDTSMEKQYAMDERPIREVLYLSEDDLLTDVPLTTRSSIVNKQCGEIFGNDEDIQLLFIKRGKEVIRMHLDEEQMHEGDLLYVLGNEKSIRNKFQHELDLKETDK